MTESAGTSDMIASVFEIGPNAANVLETFIVWSVVFFLGKAAINGLVHVSKYGIDQHIKAESAYRH